MSDNWVVQNLQNALDTWNAKLQEIWTLITTTPQNFKGGGIWSVIVNINGAMQAMSVQKPYLGCASWEQHRLRLSDSSSTTE